MMKSFKQMRGFTLLKISSLPRAREKEEDAAGMFPNAVFGKELLIQIFHLWFCLMVNNMLAGCVFMFVDPEVMSDTVSGYSD